VKGRAGKRDKNISRKNVVNKSSKGGGGRETKRMRTQTGEKVEEKKKKHSARNGFARYSASSQRGEKTLFKSSRKKSPSCSGKKEKASGKENLASKRVKLRRL